MRHLPNIHLGTLLIQRAQSGETREALPSYPFSREQPIDSFRALPLRGRKHQAPEPRTETFGIGLLLFPNMSLLLLKEKGASWHPGLPALRTDRDGSRLLGETSICSHGATRQNSVCDLLLASWADASRTRGRAHSILSRVFHKACKKTTHRAWKHFRSPRFFPHSRDTFLLHFLSSRPAHLLASKAPPSPIGNHLI